MNPTPAEIALWRTLNREPEGRNGATINDDWSEITFNDASAEWIGWIGRWCEFVNMRHRAERLAYFEGLVRACRQLLSIGEMQDGGFVATWKDAVTGAQISASGVTELDARFHAATRALAALGVIDDATG